jgi:hypothetical protein
MFKVAQQPAFPAMDPLHWPRPRRGIAFKLRAIDIDKVHDDPTLKGSGYILRHLSGKNKDATDVPITNRFFHERLNLIACK